jgi:hypothetical protein
MSEQINELPNPTTESAAPGGSQWTEHNAPNGRKYYYNGATGESTWER